MMISHFRILHLLLAKWTDFEAAYKLKNECVCFIEPPLVCLDEASKLTLLPNSRHHKVSYVNLFLPICRGQTFRYSTPTQGSRMLIKLIDHLLYKNRSHFLSCILFCTTLLHSLGILLAQFCVDLL